MDNFRVLIARLVPAVLLAGGVALLLAGLLSYAPPATLGDQDPDDPGFVAGDPVGTPPAATETPGETPSVPPFMPSFSPTSPTDDPQRSLNPGWPVPPSPSPTPTGDVARASRIVIPSLRIDLPVVPGNLVVRRNPDFYPLCDVAQTLESFVQPGQEGSTYIYGHAQRGMFLPMLRASWRNDGAEMIGAVVEVYTSDLKLHLYEIFRVKRHATNFNLAWNLEPGEQRLVLQTSEGPAGHVPKLQVAARPISVVPATADQALPEPKPRVCAPR
jgi:hypothetical protein